MFDDLKDDDKQKLLDNSRPNRVFDDDASIIQIDNTSKVDNKSQIEDPEVIL